METCDKSIYIQALHISYFEADCSFAIPWLAVQSAHTEGCQKSKFRLKDKADKLKSFLLLHT